MFTFFKRTAIRAVAAAATISLFGMQAHAFNGNYVTGNTVTVSDPFCLHEESVAELMTALVQSFSSANDVLQPLLESGECDVYNWVVTIGERFGYVITDEAGLQWQALEGVRADGVIVYGIGAPLPPS